MIGLHLAGCYISDLTPLANLTQLEWLTLEWQGNDRITDIKPLANLTKLRHLRLNGNRIVDISPLANLVNLEMLRLDNNQIVDVSPLLYLTRLKELYIHGNQIIDHSPIVGLSLDTLQYDEECILPRPYSITERIENRSLPSVFQPWDDATLNMTHLPYLERIIIHDLYFASPRHGVQFRLTPTGFKLIGSLETAINNREQLARNPNMIVLASIRQRDSALNHPYPDDWAYWLRDENGNRVANHESSTTFLIDTTHPAVQDAIVEQAIAAAQCGLYDGIFFDWWHEEGRSLGDYSQRPIKLYRTPEAEREARLSILRRIRQAVPDDFLILCNRNRRKSPISAPYINGAFMETFQDYEGGYTYGGLIEIENALIWNETNLREPQINCLEGWGIAAEPPDSPANKRWMRVFTTMSLTLSDGYVLYNDSLQIREGKGIEHEHWWYDFWNADLGQPIGLTAQRYHGIEGLYIREFTNGWAVYNRSGKAQEISLPQNTNGVAGGKSGTIHSLLDLDGEIYLKGKNPADLNGDGHINILDLILVANGFGQSTPDPNGDGTSNILDLVFVAQQFSQ